VSVDCSACDSFRESSVSEDLDAGTAEQPEYRGGIDRSKDVDARTKARQRASSRRPSAALSCAQNTLVAKPDAFWSAATFAERELLRLTSMTMRKQIGQYLTRRATRRLTRTLPWIGGLLALATVGQAIRRKGMIGGTADTALDFIPFVGGAKNIAEAIRGRDFIRDRRSA
jgi:hypothetical protein